MEPPSPSRLETWQEIASYLGVSVRTAQRFEREHGLPVYRLPGKRSRVYATTQELEAWRTRMAKVVAAARTAESEGIDSGNQSVNICSDNEVTAPGRLLKSGRRWLSSQVILSTGLLLASLGAILIIVRLKPWPLAPATFEARGQEFICRDKDGRELWRFTFPQSFFIHGYQGDAKVHNFRVVDLDGDGQSEVLFIYIPEARTTAGSTLYCFTNRGKVKWTFVPGRRIRTATQEFSPTFGISRMLPFSDSGQIRLAITSPHTAGYPNQMVVLDNAGKLLGEYWHSGHLPHIAAADLDGDGRQEILLEGVNDGHGFATLVVFDPRNVHGASVQPPGDHRQFIGFEQGSEKAIVFFRKTCVSRPKAFNRAFQLEVGQDFIRVIVAEDIQVTGAPYVAYELDFNFKVKAVMASSGFNTKHRELEDSGTLDHRLTQQEIEESKQVQVVRKPW